MKFFARGLTAVLLLFAATVSCPAPMTAQEKPATETQLDTAIRDFLMRNPKVIRDALAKAELDEQTERTTRILQEQREAIYRSGSPTIGPENAKISIVEFYDYNCPYCRKTHPLLLQFLAANPDARIVLKDIANLGQESEAISRLVIASRKQGKFPAFHEALMTRQGRTTEAAAFETARKLGIDTAQMKKDAATPETDRVLSTTRELATSLSVEGTPLMIIGQNGIAGAPDDLSAQLTKYVDQVRQSGCDVC